MKHEWVYIPSIKDKTKRRVGLMQPRSLSPPRRICSNCGAEQEYSCQHWHPPVGICNDSNKS